MDGATSSEAASTSSPEMIQDNGLMMISTFRNGSGSPVLPRLLTMIQTAVKLMLLPIVVKMVDAKNGDGLGCLGNDFFTDLFAGPCRVVSRI